MELGEAFRRPLWIYWEGPRPLYIELCIELIRLHNPDTCVIGPEELLELGFPPDVWQAIGRWHVAQRSDAIRFYLLWRFGGMWSDADCIPMLSFWPFKFIAEHSPAGVASYDSTDQTVGCGFTAARPHAEPIAEMWDRIQALARSGGYPGWLDVSTRPFTEIVYNFGRELFPIWPLEHISPISWREQEKLLEQKSDDDHRKLFLGFPAAWCWMLCNTVLQGLGVPEWSRHELLGGRSLLAFLFRESHRRATYKPMEPKGRAVAVLNVHGDWYPQNLRESARHAAQRWGADFVEITNPIVPWPDAYWEKMNLDRHLWMYERVVYLDRDVSVRSDCPSLFELVPEDAFGVVPSEQEGHNLIEAHIRPQLGPLCQLLGVDLDYETQYYNSGVMVFSPQKHKRVFELARAIDGLVRGRTWVTSDQGSISLALAMLAEKVHRLPPTFNRCGAKLWDNWQPKQDDYIWHFCGKKTWEQMAETQWRVDQG